MIFAFTVSISKPPAEVFSWIDNPEKAMQWQKGVRKSSILHETPERVGTTFWEEMEEDGKSLEMTGRISAYIPGQMISFHLKSKIHTVDVSYTVEPDDGSSLLQIETSIHWKFPMSVTSLFMGRQIREGIKKQTGAELAELKRLCESE
ncbi:MAG: SRPBCC family protein [Anaerolineaceae bacterium]